MKDDRDPEGSSKKKSGSLAPTNAAPQRELKSVRLALLAAALFGILAIGHHYYRSLPEPRYWLPKSANDWAAWGTCIGAVFTGTALFLTGLQIRNQVRASADDAAERDRNRLAAAKQVQWRVSVETHQSAVQGTLEGEEAAVWCPATEVKATSHLPSTREVTGLAINFPSTLAVGPYGHTDEFVAARNNGDTIVSNPTCTWLSRERTMRTIGSSNYQYWPMQTSSPAVSPQWFNHLRRRHSPWGVPRGRVLDHQAFDRPVSDVHRRQWQQVQPVSRQHADPGHLTRHGSIKTTKWILRRTQSSR